MNREIQFTKFKDPYSRNHKELKDEENVEEEDYDDEGNLLDEEFLNIVKPNRSNYIATPLGLVPVNEYTNPSSIFNMWTCDTNFRLTEYIVQMIEGVDGVESIDVFTPYKLRLCIGKLFDDRDVRENIRKKVCEEQDVGIVNSDIRDILPEIYNG